jgi:glycosyltransferase involved in cell wall biosynthesis
MIKVLQINSRVNSGSTGRIAEDIGVVLQKSGYRSIIAAAYTENRSISQTIKIGNDIDRKLHGIKTRLFDSHGFGSKRTTKHLVKTLTSLNPDIIHLHNIHGYYINIGLLFDYIKATQAKVVWTLHDCWPFTGHCAYFDSAACFKWETQCGACPMKHGYPKSWLIDNSRKNFARKKELFTGQGKMILVSPSQWLAAHLSKSFLSAYDTRVINNGVDLSKFKPADSSEVRMKYGISPKYILGVAGIWNSRKGLEDFIKLRELLTRDLDIILVGLTPGQIRILPVGIIGIRKTDCTEELSALYSGAEVFVNPTYVDNFPTVNIESLACGTPVITYNTGGSPEAIDHNTGIILKKGDIAGIVEAIETVMQSDDKYSPRLCRERAELLFSTEDRYRDYIKLYEELIS